MLIAHIVLSVLLALLLIATGGGKLAGTASSHSIRDSLHLKAAAWKSIGVFELVAVVALVAGIWINLAAIVGAGLSCLLFIGAIITRLRAGGPQRNRGTVADAILLVLATVTLALAIAR